MNTRKLADETRVLEEHWAWLVPLDGADAGKVLRVSSPTMVGTDPACSLRLRGESVATHHVELVRRQPGAWTLTDHAGERRTKIDGDWLGSGQAFDIHDGAHIEIGSLSLVFKCVG